MHHTLDQLHRGELAGTRRLNLAAGLMDFPVEIFDLSDSLEVLDLSHNQLDSLPDSLPRLKKLQRLFLSNNNFETVPEVLSQCSRLSMIAFKGNRIHTLPDHALPPRTRWLILTDNCLESLPASLGSLPCLQKVSLAGNRLRHLPGQLIHCQHLEFIRVAANQLEEFPTWLLSLPRLTWFGYAGNPFCADWSQPGRGQPQLATPQLTTPQLTTIDWHQLVLGEVLGQGASGIISRGVWNSGDGDLEVAVKVFKGEVTSDGYPIDEMQACLAVGSHSNLMSPLGQISNHPEQKTGLVFPLAPADYRSLGNPPSLDSCTRDTYSPETHFSVQAVLNIALDVAAAVAHLHQRGILHGDLYAHNILSNHLDRAILGDFGAASFYPESLATRLEPTEIRAFGCLLEDLLSHCPTADSPSASMVEDLHQLCQDCMDTRPDQRPGFSLILDQMEGLVSTIG
ncbi:MAG: leucine-rich repeat-containing serine/threonine-protein kinase [Cyanobacteria bacterium REEB459]|nr:leucine-rich repeat-containing serine/threonine-protein kinase [Cyanobacteria bacterium REEB459]